MTVIAALIDSPEIDFVAFHPENGTTTQGDTVAEALGNLRQELVSAPQAGNSVLSHPAASEAAAPNPASVSARIPIAERWPSPRSESKLAPRN